LTNLVTSATVARFRREGVAEPASLRPEDDDQPDDDQPDGDGWYDEKLDRKVRRLNGEYMVGDFVLDLLNAIVAVLSAVTGP
jgi:hypothetical protein